MRGPIPYGGNPGMAIKAGPSVVAIARGAGEFGTLITALDAAGLTGLLEGDGPYTLFAPTDAAFKKLPPGALQDLLGDEAKLVALLKYHGEPGHVPARNGLIKVVDTVLLPPG